MSKETLFAKLETRLAVQLTKDDQVITKQILRPIPLQGFSAEQRSLMAEWFLVVPKERLPELEALNRDRNSIAQPVVLADGSHLLPVSLLTNCEPGETFGHLREFLLSLKHRKVDSYLFSPPVVLMPISPTEVAKSFPAAVLVEEKLPILGKVPSSKMPKI